MPAIQENRDVIAIAQTGESQSCLARERWGDAYSPSQGSGKTAAFLIPTISQLMGKAKKLAAPRPSPLEPCPGGTCAEPLVLIIVPTRELSVQIFDECRRLCYRSMLRPCVAYGGGPIRDQADDLRRGCDILIGTPGRLIDFMTRPGLLSLARVRYIILDEADELVQPDWAEDLQRLLCGGGMWF
jgi:ATP-dependent RNA helicase DDX3X